MKFVKGMALTMLGAASVLAYQKYEKPMMKEAKKTVSKVMKQTGNKLENIS